jgi:hypothetical protein
MMVTEAKKIKAHKLLKNNEPVLNPMDYSRSVIDALNYYNVNHDNREKKKWFVSHFRDGKMKIDFSLDIPDGNFKIIGTLCRMLDNGNDLSAQDMTRLEHEFDKIKETSAQAKKQEALEAKPLVKVSNIQEKMDQKAAEFLGEFAGLIDEFVTTGTAPSVDKLIASMKITGPVAKKVQSRLAVVERNMEEIRAAIAGKDKEVAAAYAHITKPNLKKLLALYESLISGLGQAKVVAVRKARVVKEKPPVQVAKYVKFNPEDTTLGLKSIAPALMIGASEIWLFNPKYKKMIVYQAVVGTSMTVKGTTLVNFDIEKSTMKTVKKPDTVAKLNGMGTRAFHKFYKETKAAEGKCNGRINKDCIILAAFK